MATIDLDVFLTAATTGGACGIGVRGTLTRSGDNYVADNQNIGTSAEVVSIGDCATGNHFAFLKNADPTNYCTLYADGATGLKPIGKLYPGQFAAFVIKNGVSIGAKANTAGIILEKLIVENVITASGGLTIYAPSAPAAGYSTAQATITATIGSATVAINSTTTEAIAGLGLIAPWSASDSGYTEAYPDATLYGGNNFGHVLAVNLSVDELGQLAESTGAVQFGVADAFNGFVLMPLNASTAEATKIQGDGSAIGIASVATRKTI